MKKKIATKNEAFKKDKRKISKPNFFIKHKDKLMFALVAAITCSMILWAMFL